jgi:nucleotide-binding universal stress UspA family protein
MLRILVPVDGSENAARAVEYVIALAATTKDNEIHVVTVRDPMDSLQVHRFWTDEQIHAFQQESGNAALDRVRNRLDKAGIAYTPHIVIGETAQTIVKTAQELSCDLIVMGTRGMGNIANLLMGSVATKVVHLTTVPVTLVK